MPTPIPDWDLARRLVAYVGMKQIIGELVTVRETSVTLGIGRERMIKIMEEKGIIYKIISGKEENSGADLLAIEYVPRNLALDAGISNQELDRSYKKLMERELQGEIRVIPRRRKRMTRQQREKMRIREFWGGKEMPT